MNVYFLFPIYGENVPKNIVKFCYMWYIPFVRFLDGQNINYSVILM